MKFIVKMNYVAHLFLAEPSDEHRIGSLLADFTVGTIATMRSRYEDQIASAYVQMHINRKDTIFASFVFYGSQNGLYTRHIPRRQISRFAQRI